MKLDLKEALKILYSGNGQTGLRLTINEFNPMYLDDGSDIETNAYQAISYALQSGKCPSGLCIYDMCACDIKLTQILVEALVSGMCPQD